MPSYETVKECVVERTKEVQPEGKGYALWFAVRWKQSRGPYQENRETKVKIYSSSKEGLERWAKTVEPGTLLLEVSGPRSVPISKENGIKQLDSFIDGTPTTIRIIHPSPAFCKRVTEQKIS